MEQLGLNIRSLRSRAGLKQKDLAKLAGVDQSTISNIERDPLGATQETLQKIARALGVTIGVLYAEADTVDAAALGARRVPVIDPQLVHNWRGADEARIDWEDHRFIWTELKTASRFAFALEISGSLNAPSLEPGDVAIFDLNLQPWPGMFVAATNAAGKLSLGKFRELSIIGGAQPAFEVVPADGFHAVQSSLQPGGLGLKGVMVELRKYPHRNKI